MQSMRVRLQLRPDRVNQFAAEAAPMGLAASLTQFPRSLC